ncbi:PH domain-containing protein [Roseiconus nitratireducens]|nr:PH domain-containing protein [Roseiconus nitratireducens]
MNAAGLNSDDKISDPPHDPPAQEMKRPRKSVYPSAVDWWLLVLLLIGPLILIMMSVLLLGQGRAREAGYCMWASAGTLLVTAMFTVPCRYTILSDSLTIRCGILFNRVPLEQIRAIEPSRSWLSGPALSLRRVKISTASRFYLVSPAERDRFIAELTDAVDRAHPSGESAPG